MVGLSEFLMVGGADSRSTDWPWPYQVLHRAGLTGHILIDAIFDPGFTVHFRGLLSGICLVTVHDLLKCANILPLAKSFSWHLSSWQSA